MALGETELMDNVLGFAEWNVASVFDFTHDLLNAKNVQDVVTTQIEFFEAQIKATADQVGGLGETTMKTMSSVTKSRFVPPSIPYGLVARGSEGRAKPVNDA
jgi:hypothetical protein